MKTGDGLSRPGVRIPPHPLRFETVSDAFGSGLLFFSAPNKEKSPQIQTQRNAFLATFRSLRPLIFEIRRAPNATRSGKFQANAEANRRNAQNRGEKAQFPKRKYEMNANTSLKARLLSVFFGIFSVFATVEFVAAQSPGTTLGRARPLAKAGAVVERAANVVASTTNLTSNSNANDLGTSPNVDSNSNASPFFGNAVDFNAPSRPIYSVGSRETRWTDRDGVERSALAFYPTTPPVSGSKFPAIAYSPGLGASAEQFAYLASGWARLGFVVLLLRHPGSDEAIWRGKVRPLAELRDAYKTCWPARDRALAIRSAIDFLYSVHSTDGPLGSAVDLDKIGVAGNDLGALAALLVSGQLPPDNGPSLKDDRVAAALALSPTVFCEAELGSVVYSLIDVPTASVAGTEDDGVVGNTKAEQRRIPFDSVRKTDAYLLTLIGGDHLVYGGHRMKSRQSNDAPFQETIRHFSSIFWLAYLANDAEAIVALESRENRATYRNATIERKNARQ